MDPNDQTLLEKSTSNNNSSAFDFNSNRSSTLGISRYISNGCHGYLEPSGQEVTRLICNSCGQNYNVVVYLKPIPPKEDSRFLLLEELSSVE
jgi:hypothetical protein